MSLDSRVKLRHLKAFIETVRQRGVGPAAEALGMTQPAISRAIAELEDILGLALFDRNRRALALTPSGELFERFAQASLATLEQGFDALDRIRTGQRRVAFGALPTVAAGLVPRALSLFAQSPVACPTRVESGPSTYLLDLLRTTAIDFVVGRLPSPQAMERLSFEHLYSERLAVAVRPSHPLAGRASVELRDLTAYQLLLPPQGAIIRPTVDTLLIGGGIAGSLNPIETVSNSLGRSYALMTDAVWIISEGVIERDVATGALSRLPVDVSSTLGPIGITTRSEPDFSLATRTLLDCIRASVAHLPNG